MRTLLSGWHFMRVLRLVLGIGVVVQRINDRDWAIGLMGLLFALLALTNTACCGINGCATPRNFKQINKIGESE